jgi:hypothetical protein
MENWTLFSLRCLWLAGAGDVPSPRYRQVMARLI